MQKDEDPNWLFSNEYKTIYRNDIGIKLFWIIDNNFLEEAELCGLWQLNFLMFLQDQCKNDEIILFTDIIILNPNLSSKYRYLEKSLFNQNFWDEIRE